MDAMRESVSVLDLSNMIEEESEVGGGSRKHPKRSCRTFGLNAAFEFGSARTWALGALCAEAHRNAFGVEAKTLATASDARERDRNSPADAIRGKGMRKADRLEACAGRKKEFHMHWSFAHGTRLSKSRDA